MKPTPKCSLFNSLSSHRSKVKVKVTKRSKTYFGHNTFSFRPIHMKPTPKFSLFSSLSFDRSKVKVRKRSRSKTYFGHNTLSFHPIHMKPVPKCSFFNSLSSDRSKVKVKVIKRSKTYFDHNMLSFCPIHMKPMPKCSLFNSLTSDMVTNVVLAKVCTLARATRSGQGKEGTRGQKTPMKIEICPISMKFKPYILHNKEIFPEFSSFC